MTNKHECLKHLKDIIVENQNRQLNKNPKRGHESMEKQTNIRFLFKTYSIIIDEFDKSLIHF